MVGETTREHPKTEEEQLSEAAKAAFGWQGTCYDAFTIIDLIGQKVDGEMFYYIQTSHLVIKSEPMGWSLDGEFGGEHDCVNIRNWKQGMRIMVKSQMIQQLSVKGRIENTQILEEVGMETKEISEK